MDTDKIPGYLSHLGRSLENTIAKKLGDRDSNKEESRDEPPMRYSGAEFEPDWDDLDRKANLVVARYTAVGAAANILPFGMDVAAVTVVFTKLTIELAGIYQVIMSNKRARQLSWAFATTTGAVLGAAYAGSKLASFIPGGYFVTVAVQAPLVGAVVWAAGDTLKDYFKQTRRGREPSLEGLRDSFAKTLRIKLNKVKIDAPTGKGKAGSEVAPASAHTAASAPVVDAGDAIEKIAALHELLRIGAITQEEFDAKKKDLLSRY